MDSGHSLPFSHSNIQTFGSDVATPKSTIALLACHSCIACNCLLIAVAAAVRMDDSGDCSNLPLTGRY